MKTSQEYQGKNFKKKIVPESSFPLLYEKDGLLFKMPDNANRPDVAYALQRMRWRLRNNTR